MKNDGLVETLPTKELFVYVLTRDIKLDEAVLDLVDNCIDGARRLHPGVDDRFDGKWVKISCSADAFSIRDNCGGIPTDLAQNYAFRFGRDKKMGKTPNSIGQFGVGMKRALLRFGHHFTVESVSGEEFFKLVVDVDEWLGRDDWHFKFSEVRPRAEGEILGTSIRVERLTEDATARFPVGEFQTGLRNQLEKNCQEYLARGLVIELNESPIQAQPFELLFDEKIEPAKKTKIYFEDTDTPVTAQFIAGIGPSIPIEAGWYLACNGRIILSGDQSTTTGWDTISEEGVPKYHNQFSRFRGYALFTCIDSGKLPWNTMKTGVNPDSAIYQDARREMIALMRPVIDVLNQLDRENNEPEDERPLTAIIEAAKPTAYGAAKSYSQSFKVEMPTRPAKPPMVNINFKRLKQEAAELVDAMGANSSRNAAELAWDEAYSRYVDGE